MKPTLVVPCFNEAERLDFARFTVLVEEGVKLLFVDDGSRDDTRSKLEAFAGQLSDVAVLSLEKNSGKGEAVRRGLLSAIEGGAQVVGYLDADLATPPHEMLRILGILKDADVVLGSRVALLGRSIERSPTRHLLGRVFATAASMALGLRVYDTQCGAKAFKVTPAFRAAIAQPFTAAWAFDVELLSRLLAPPDGSPALEPSRIIEVPLTEWRDVKGSKLKATHMAKAGADVLRMAITRARR